MLDISCVPLKTTFGQDPPGPSPHPTSDICWPKLETCWSLFIWGSPLLPPSTPLVASGGQDQKPVQTCSLEDPAISGIWWPRLETHSILFTWGPLWYWLLLIGYWSKYGGWVSSTHPTGMLSCYIYFMTLLSQTHKIFSIRYHRVVISVKTMLTYTIKIAESSINSSTLSNLPCKVPKWKD